MTRRLRRGATLVWALPALALVALFVYYPIVENVRLSFYHWNTFSPAQRFVGLDNYREAIHDPVLWHALRNNVAYAVVSVVVQVGFGLVLAALVEEFVLRRLRRIVQAILMIPSLLSVTVAGLLFQFVYDPKIGLIDTGLRAVGLDGLAHAWLGEPATAIWSIIAMSQWQSVGYVMLLFCVAIRAIPRDLYEAAACDGAGRIRTFFNVTVPLVRQMTTLMTVITISGAFLVFNEVMVTTGGGPGNASHVLGTWLYQQAFLNDDMGYAATIATVLFALTTITGALQLLWVRRRAVEVAP